MRRIYFLFSLIFCCCQVTNAQTQQGIVKTRGRMVNGQLVSGQRLTGATVTLSFGNPLVSGNNGAFSFNVPSGKNYSLVAAKKQGYTLADPEYTRRSFAYSGNNPFYVVLEDENQRQADINAATRKLRRTLTTQLQAREDEIEALKSQNKITEKEYQERLKQLYDSQSKTDSLVQVMAERYATTDYDQLDEFNRQVQMYIEEGELQKADSMIRSKGDIEKRVAEYHNVVAANKEVRKKLEQSETATAKTYEDLSQDLYRKAEIYKQEHRYDSALHCMILQAELDTTNFETMHDCAHFADVMTSNDSIAEKYYLMCLNLALARKDKALIAQAQFDLGHLYSYFNKGNASDYFLNLGLNYLNQALSNREELYAKNPDKYRLEFTSTLDALCLYCRNNEKYEECMKYGIRANKLYHTLVCQKTNTNIEDQFLSCYATIVEATYEQLVANKTHKEGLDYITETLELVDSVTTLALLQYDGAYTHHIIGKTYYQLGRLYHQLKDYPKAERFYIFAGKHREQADSKDPEIGFRWSLGDTWRQMMKLYKESNNMEAYDSYLEKSILLYSSDIQKNKFEITELQFQKINRLIAKNQLNEALDLASANLDLDKDNIIAQFGILIATVSKVDELIKKKEYDEAITAIGHALALMPDSASIRNSCHEQDIEELSSEMMKYIQFADIALSTQKSEILYEQDKNKENLVKVLEGYEQLVSYYPNNNKEALAIFYPKLLVLCDTLNEKEKYELYFEKALELYTDLYKSQPSVYKVILIEMQNMKVRQLLSSRHIDEAINLAKKTCGMNDSSTESKRNLAKCYNSKAYEYARELDFNNAFQSIDTAISLWPDHANYYDTKGEIYLIQGKNKKALAMWKKVLKLNPDFLKHRPDGTNLSNGLKKLGLIE